MPRSEPTEAELVQREKISVEIKDFMEKNLITEVRLAEISGLSRRTIQQLKAARCTPHKETLRKWLAIKARYDRNAA